MTKESKSYIKGRLASEEVLIITQEECAEVIHAISKAMRFGLPDNKERLEQEIGDLLCMVYIMIEKNIISAEKMEEYTKVKREKLKKWSNIL